MQILNLQRSIITVLHSSIDVKNLFRQTYQIPICSIRFVFLLKQKKKIKKKYLFAYCEPLFPCRDLHFRLNFSSVLGAISALTTVSAILGALKKSQEIMNSNILLCCFLIMRKQGICSYVACPSLPNSLETHQLFSARPNSRTATSKILNCPCFMTT